MGVEMFDNKPMMTLTEYMSAHPGKTHEQWAAEVGISRSHFTQIVAGSAYPSRKVIQRIDALTGGQVPPAVWYRSSEAAE